LQPLKRVCILQSSPEDLDHAWLLICQDDLFAAGGAAAALMSLGHQDIEAVAHRVVGLRRVGDAAIGGPC
jgi:hypothetical protein